jgi:hypothetical protein
MRSRSRSISVKIAVVAPIPSGREQIEHVLNGVIGLMVSGFRSCYRA